MNKKILVILISLAFILPSIAYSNDKIPDLIKQELELRLKIDQNLKNKAEKLFKKMGRNTPEVQNLWDKQKARDIANTKRLDSIISRYGWPTKQKVGFKAALSAFLILQHSNLDFQTKLFPIIKKSDVSKDKLALLEDRIRIKQGKPQIYGTQIITNPKTSKFELAPICDEKNLDLRRKEMGLEPIAEYVKMWGIEYRAQEKN